MYDDDYKNDSFDNEIPEQSIDEGVGPVTAEEREYMAGDGADRYRLDFLRNKQARKNMAKQTLVSPGIIDEEEQFAAYQKYHRFERQPTIDEKLQVLQSDPEQKERLVKNFMQQGKTADQAIKAWLKWHRHDNIEF